MEPTIEPDAPVTRPSQVTRAAQLLTSALVLGLVASAIRLARQIHGLQLALSLLILVAFLTVLFYLVMKIWAGRNWARILLLVLVVLNTPFAILGYLAEAQTNVVPAVLSLIIVVLQVLATVLLFTKPAHRWFRKSSYTN
jgi:hypothetical protein